MGDIRNNQGEVQGWLTRYGKFYPCEAWKHRLLAEELVEKYDLYCNGNISADFVLEKEGYIRITGDNVYSLQTSMYVDDDNVFFKKITQKQLNFLLDHYNKFNEAQKEAVNQLVKLANMYNNY